jgi:hypothetical protein
MNGWPACGWLMSDGWRERSGWPVVLTGCREWFRMALMFASRLADALLVRRYGAILYGVPGYS